MTDIRVYAEGGRVVLASPYHPALPAEAKRLGGRFDGEKKTWRFDARDEERVRDLAREIYGTDGTESDLVSVRLTAEQGCDEADDMWLFGREIMRRPGRDQSVRLGEGVIRIAGAFLRGGRDAGTGSVAYPRIGEVGGVVLEVRDVPRSAVEGVTYGGWDIEIVEERVDMDALRAERERLAARIAEIDEILGTN
ncbi:hypothetical protein [Nocardioides sp. KR10-350]|uniref:hypothetical protein n=1 Tax=Nocardioides cheoyonin TaxID=3156615 RepID=UPI0032B34CAE